MVAVPHIPQKLGAELKFTQQELKKKTSINSLTNMRMKGGREERTVSYEAVKRNKNEA